MDKSTTESTRPELPALSVSCFDELPDLATPDSTTDNDDNDMYAPDETTTNEPGGRVTRPPTPAPMVHCAGSSWDLTAPKGTAKIFAVTSGPELQDAIAAAYHAGEGPTNDDQLQYPERRRGRLSYAPIPTFFPQNGRHAHENLITFGSNPSAHHTAPDIDNSDEYTRFEWLFLAQILEYCQGKEELHRGIDIPDELREGQFLEGLGEEGIISLHLPILESLFRRASRTWPGTVFGIFAPASPPANHDNCSNLRPLTSATSAHLPMPPTTSEDETISLSEDEWMYPPSSTPFPTLELPCLILRAPPPQEELPPLDIPLRQFEDLQVDASEGHQEVEQAKQDAGQGTDTQDIPGDVDMREELPDSAHPTPIATELPPAIDELNQHLVNEPAPEFSPLNDTLSPPRYTEKSPNDEHDMAIEEVLTSPPHSMWNPCGIHMESMSFQMDSIHSIWNMFWLKSQPFWLFHSIWNPLGMIWIPCGFHHSIWNFHLDSIWNHEIDSTTVPHGFHVDSIWNDGIHMDSTWIPIILTLEYS